MGAVMIYMKSITSYLSNIAHLWYKKIMHKDTLRILVHVNMLMMDIVYFGRGCCCYGEFISLLFV